MPVVKYFSKKSQQKLILSIKINGTFFYPYSSIKKAFFNLNFTQSKIRNKLGLDKQINFFVGRY